MKHLIALALALASLQGWAQNTISGYIKDASTGEYLIGATLYDFNSGKGTTTNVYGFYSLTLPQDSVKLRVSFVGYESQIIAFYLDADKDLSFDLGGAVEIKEFEVVASETETIQEKSEMSTIDVSMDKVKSLPVLLGEKDVMKTIQLLPGVQSGSEGSSGLYVRGGGPDQNLILLDGVPIYNASHLFGFFSVFNADAINSVKLIKGGFPSRYGGRLSSVIDIRMKEGNMKEFHGEGSIGIISSKLTLEGPIVKDKTSFIVSGRRTYLDLLARPFIKAASEDGSFGGYYFYDVNAKVNHKFSEKSRLYASGYFGNDDFYSRLRDNYTSNGVTYEDEENGDLKWGNVISALRWNYQFSNKLFSNTTATYSRYRFVVDFEENSSRTDASGTTSDNFYFAYTSGIQDWSLKTDFDYLPHPDHYVKFGVGYTYHTFTPGVNTFQANATGEQPIDTVFGSQVQYSNEFYAYAEDDVKIGTRFKGNLGLHFAGFLTDNKTYTSLQPRFSGRYMIDEKTSIKASYARMTQFLHLLTNAGIGLPTDLWLPVTDSVPPQQSHQVALGVARTVKEQYEVSVEGYYKTMENLIEYKDGASFFGSETDWQKKVEIGRGWSYGAELLIEKKRGKTTGWIGYTLSWANRQFDNLNFGQTFPYRYDRRHDLGIAVTHKFNDRVDIGLVYVYGTGNAVTLGLERYNSLGSVFSEGLYDWESGEIEHIEQRNNYRMPSYHRLDVGVNLHKKTKWGERTWSFGLYNAYSRQNPFYLYFSYDASGQRRLTQVSLFPVIPSFSYQFKF